MTVSVHENVIHKDLINSLKEECKKIHHFSTKTIGSIRDSKYTTFWLGKDDKPKSDPNKVYNIAEAGSVVLGNPNASVTVIEWTDFQ